ncbi:NAD(P)-binding domain-containing protein [Paludibaculum fermentans]|uniref:NAD(P)-binding domain-containing protein n=1 Tax=Paludibaculum fermentans TaxID=1473598 RepID=A0A7S7NSH6_PALFE|nr:NAD(P)-binding domain-containing protein [Paludibaculum fermentans]QOY88886.1 NAD(P)-binding domain-containing protein [Paludibaculum fermentans]
MSETVLTYAFTLIVILVPLAVYLTRQKSKARKAREAIQRGELYSEGPKAQHPHIDTTYCIGCQSCTTVCPEGDVLAMLGGKAVIVNGYKCIGHGLCADACPVGAITMVMAKPAMGADMPFITAEYETSVTGLFIAGELGGLALIKNAVNQGRDCVETITRRLESSTTPKPENVLDVLIVGAGPAGISASLKAIENKLKYITIERDEIGGTVSKYPRQKLVMTSPVQFPMYGKFTKTELSKENLLEFWHQVLGRSDFNVRTSESVEGITKREDGVFEVTTGQARYLALHVILALGRSGTPRKLGVKGEDLPKVMYRLIEADHYINKRILVVGGGDSAIEAAMGLGHQSGNEVTLSYRKDSFSRIKERNAQRLQECIRKKLVQVVFNSAPVEFTPDSVVLEVNGERRVLANDYVWVFAGGTPPTAFLKQAGVAFGHKDITLEASLEANQQRATAQGARP